MSEEVAARIHLHRPVPSNVPTAQNRLRGMTVVRPYKIFAVTVYYRTTGVD